MGMAHHSAAALVAGGDRVSPRVRVGFGDRQGASSQAIVRIRVAFPTGPCSLQFRGSRSA